MTCGHSDSGSSVLKERTPVASTLHTNSLWHSVAPSDLVIALEPTVMVAFTLFTHFALSAPLVLKFALWPCLRLMPPLDFTLELPSLKAKVADTLPPVIH